MSPPPKAPANSPPAQEPTPKSAPVEEPTPKSPLAQEPTPKSPVTTPPKPAPVTPEALLNMPPPPKAVPALLAKGSQGDLDMPEGTPVSQKTLEKRISRALAPTSKGYRVSEEIRNMWESGSKNKVFRLFSQCGNDPERFIKKYSATKTTEKETEVGVFFDYRTEKDLESLPEYLGMHLNFKILRNEKKNVLARAKANPKKYMRWSDQKGEYTYYVETGVSGHAKSLGQ